MRDVVDCPAFWSYVKSIAFITFARNVSCVIANMYIGKKMKPFKEKVRYEKVIHPTQRGFSLNTWKSIYNLCTDQDEADHSIMQIGEWVFQQLESIRLILRELPLGSISQKQLPSYICGAINLQAKDLSLLEFANNEEDLLVIEQQIQAMLPQTDISSPAFPDEIITQTIDGVRYPLYQALKFKQEDTTITDKEVDLKLIQTLILLGEYYDIVEGIWMRALWEGSRMKITTNKVIFSPENMENSMNLAVSEYRRQALQLQSIHISLGAWKRMASKDRESLLLEIPQVRITKVGKRKRLSVFFDCTNSSVPPLSLIRRIVWEQELSLIHI